MPVKNIFREESGTVVLFLFFLMLFTVLGVATFDFSRAHTVRARLRTASDAAALAASMTAKAQYEYDYAPVDKDNDGVTDEIHQELKEVHMRITEPDASAAAKEAYEKNMPPVGNSDSEWGVRTEPDSGKSEIYSDTYHSEKDGVRYYADSYSYEAKARVKAFLMSGALADWLTGVDKENREIPVRGVGKSEAVPLLE